MNWSGSAGLAIRPVSDGDFVLVEVKPVHAPVAVARAGRKFGDVLLRGAVGLQGQDVDAGLRLHSFHVGEVRDLGDQRPVIGRKGKARVEDPRHAERGQMGWCFSKTR